MTSFDYIVLAIVLVSAVLGFLRGLIKEVLSLVAYVVSFLAAVWWGPLVSQWLAPWIENSLLRTGVAYGAVFLLILLLVGLVNITLATFIDRTGLSPADSGMGTLFGVLRGVLMVLVLVSLGGYTELPKEAWWQDASLAPLTERSLQQIKPLLPAAVAAWVPY